MSLPADDMQFVQQRELSTAEICGLFGVPPWMIGGATGDSLTYATSEQQQLLFVTLLRCGRGCADRAGDQRRPGPVLARTSTSSS